MPTLSADRVARRAEPETSKAVEDLLASWRKGWTLTAIRRLLALAPGTAADAMDPSRPSHGVLLKSSDGDDLYRILLRIITTAAEQPAADFGFDIKNPHAARYARQQVALLVRQVDEATRQAIREVVRRGVADGLTIDQQARLLRDTVGLHPRQAQAVRNLRAQLEAGQSASNALMGTMREGMTAAQIDRTVEAYADRQLAYRARMIARTETMRASQNGLLAGWDQAVAEGLIPADTGVVWLVTDPCEECESVADAQNESGPLRTIGVGVFTSAQGVEVEAPPLHPNCRCSLSLDV